jgi:hypothetical protein
MEAQRSSRLDRTRSLDVRHAIPARLSAPALGAGTRMFQHVRAPISLALVETQQSTSGVILLKYRHSVRRS